MASRSSAINDSASAAEMKGVISVSQQKVSPADRGPKLDVVEQSGAIMEILHTHSTMIGVDKPMNMIDVTMLAAPMCAHGLVGFEPSMALKALCGECNRLSVLGKILRHIKVREFGY